MRVISIVGFEKTDRLALVERLISELCKHGTVGAVSQSKDGTRSNGSDTGRYLDRGALASVEVAPARSIKIFRCNGLEGAVRQLAEEGLDFTVVEGFDESDLPKIAIGDLEASNVVARVGADATAEQLAAIAMAQPDRVTLFELLAKVRRNPEIKRAGAIGTFTGIVRELSKEETTKSLEFESYDAVARERIAKIERELKQKEGIVDVLIHHKTGRIEAGEDIVYIVVAAGHRQELFPVLREAIERVKDEVPIWKKEITVSGEYWVHDEES